MLLVLVVYCGRELAEELCTIISGMKLNEIMWAVAMRLLMTERKVVSSI